MAFSAAAVVGGSCWIHPMRKTPVLWDHRACLVGGLNPSEKY